MTLHLLLATELAHQTPITITIGLGMVVGTGLVVGALAYSRVVHRIDAAEKAQGKQEERLKAVEAWRVSAERETGEIRQEVREVRRILEGMASDIRDINRTVHQQETRRGA